MDKLIEAFEKCVTISRDKRCNYTYKCNLGLWSVSAPTSPQARRNAMHYFMQYYADGEYSNLLKDQGPQLY